MTDADPDQPLSGSKGNDLDRAGPFGDPEGSRADLDNLLRDFVTFNGTYAYGDLGFGTGEILRSRVLVGGKGAGKSVYLRRLQALATNQGGSGAIYSDHDSLYADHIQQDVPSTEDVVRVSDWYDEAYLTEKWKLLWRRAIARSLVSHLLCAKNLRTHITTEVADELTSEYSALYKGFRKPLSIYSQLRDILKSHTGVGGLNQYLDRREWDELEVTLGEALANCPPICFYIDAIDDEFAHAPAYWLSCQKGLFYEVMRLLRDQPFGGKLHVMICIRDIVFSSVLRSEHADRYRDSPHIRMLSWGEDSLRFFLQTKLERLSTPYLMREKDGARSVASWLGIETITNTKRGDARVERLDDYILRHIRPLPRDIVSLGNKLCRVVHMAKARGATELTQTWISDIVGEAAKQFGDLQLTICANQISADMLYPQVVRGSSVSATAYAPAVNQQLKRFLHDHVGCDRIDNARCLEIADLASREFSSQTDILSVLWQHGLIGYGDGQMYDTDITFYRLNDSAEDLVLPLDRDFYALHSCLIESADIAPIGPPVFPFRRRPPILPPT